MWLDMLTLSLGGTDFDDFAWINRAANDNAPRAHDPLDYEDFDPAAPIEAFDDDAHIMDVCEFMTRG